MFWFIAIFLTMTAAIGMAAEAPSSPRVLQQTSAQILSGCSLAVSEPKNNVVLAEVEGIAVVIEGDKQNPRRVIISFEPPADGKETEPLTKMLRIVGNVIPGWNGMREFYDANSRLVRRGSIDNVAARVKQHLINVSFDGNTQRYYVSLIASQSN
jgi:hypothetical protein